MTDRKGVGISPQVRNILIWMCVLISVNQLGFGAVVPIAPLYAQEFGVSQTAIGLTIAVYGLARFMVNMPAGQLADRIGRRGTLATGGIVTVVGTLLCAFAPTYEVFLLGRFIAGAGAACVLTAGQIVLTDIAEPHNRGRLMAIYMGSFLFAVGAGAFPGGWLADQFTLATPFLANAALAGVVTLLAWVFVPETQGFRHAGQSEPTRTAEPELSIPQQIALLVRTPGFVLISLTSFAAFYARTGGLFNVIPLYAEDEIGLSPSQIGIGIGLISIVSLVLVYPSGMIVDRFGRKSVIVLSTLFSALGMFGFVAAVNFGTYITASVVWSIAGGIAGAAPAAYAADIAPPGRNAMTMGAYRTFADFGYVAGPLSLGLIGDLISPAAALYFTMGLLLFSGVLFAVRAPETLRRDDSEPPPQRAKSRSHTVAR